MGSLARKYVLIIPDGAADLDRQQGLSPLAAADTPYADFLAREGVSGLMQTLYPDLPKESMVAQLGLLGWAPRQWYPHGRASCELLALDDTYLAEGDLAFRANLVRMQGPTLLSYNAGFIQDSVAAPLVDRVAGALRGDYPEFELRHNSDFRNTLVIREAGVDPRRLACPEPHENQGRDLPLDRLVTGVDETSRALAERINSYLVRAAEILSGEPANALFPWSASGTFHLPSFADNTCFTGRAAVIGFMDFLKGIARAGDLDFVRLGNGRPDTDYRAKGRKIIDLLEEGYELVVCHVNAPDEASHMGDRDLKIECLEATDREVLAPVVEWFQEHPENLGGVMLVPDHYTNHRQGKGRSDAHSLHSVPFCLWNGRDRDGVQRFSEDDARAGALAGEVVSHLDLLSLLGVARGDREERTHGFAISRARGSEPGSMAEVLQVQAQAAPDRPAFDFLEDGERPASGLSYGALDRRARGIAEELAQSLAPGDRALLLYPPGLEFITAFFGCLYAGVVAVPAYPPRSGGGRRNERLAGIARDAEPKAGLSLSNLVAGGSRVPELAGIRWLATDSVAPSEARMPLPEARGLALLQYTSGSTAAPKGVMVTHANLLHNEKMIGEAFRQDRDSVVVGWLPLYHDMGLIGNVLQTVHAGARGVLMSPTAFLQRPLRWLEAISRYRGTTGGGPNFAYDLCVRKSSAEQRAALDLSSWRLAYNGAEPVRAETLERFAEAFAPSGFRREAFYPCFGLAEATLFVSGGEAGRTPRYETERDEQDPGGHRLIVSCGRAWNRQRIVAVDPESGEERASGAVGEIWISGPSVAQGYWRNPEATRRDFQAQLATEEGPFLRTGDLGFLVDGELYVTGRLKDLIILRGRNLYPQDLELTAERSHPDLRPGCGAAFSVEAAGEERLVIVHELERRARAAPEVVTEAVRRAVAEEHEVQVHEVILVRAETVPKTSSGKIQRHLCRELYRSGGLSAIERSVLATVSEPVEPSIVLTPEFLRGCAPPERRTLLGRFLRDRAAGALGIAPEAIDPGRPLIGLGLDSLAAIELKATVESTLGVELPLSALLDGATTAELADLLSAAEGGTGRAMRRSAEGDRGDQRLSEGQKALWFLHQLARESGAYNIAVAGEARGPLDVEALRRAFESLSLRHSSLRSVFPRVGDEPVRRILERPDIDLRVEEAADSSEARLAGRMAEEAYRPFDLDRGPLVRVRIFLRGGASPRLLLAVHHLAADFASFVVAARELTVLYRRETGGTAAKLAPLPVSYSDFVHWQAETLSASEGESLGAFWLDSLSGVADLDLPTDRPRPPVQTYRGAARALDLPDALADELRALAAQEGATPFMVLLAAFQVLLGRSAGQQDFAVGTPTAGRSRPELAPLIGYFVNPVALRANLVGEPDFKEWLGRVRRVTIDGLQHGDYPFARIAERLRPMRDPSRPPLVQTMFLVQGPRSGEPGGLAAFALGEAGGRISLGGLELESLRIEERRAQLDLTLRVVEEDGGRLRASLEINLDLFDEATAERMLARWQTLLAEAVADPNRAITRLPLLTSIEREQLLVTWNATAAAFPHDLLLHQLFEGQAARTPDAEAVVTDAERLTYRELNARANRLARHLRTRKVGPEVRVGVRLGRSADLVTALLAVLKAGGAYVPLDPAYPEERLLLMTADSGLKVVIGSPGEAPPEVESVDLERDDALLATYDDSDLEPTATARNLAYLIYTSGSTGRPKAVAIEHRSPVALIHWARKAYSSEELSGVLASTSMAFDLSVFEFFVPLSWGGRVVVAESALDLPRLAAREEVTLVNTVPSVLAELLRGPKLPASVRTINLAGEPVPATLVDAVCALPGIERLDNLYGPSEDTTYSSGTRLAAYGEVTIGRPLENTRAYVLDERGEAVPVGIPGELYLGGEGTARGYLGRPDLTAERFVPDPFADERGGRLYRTGDRVRWNAAGDLSFLGRVDRQVKVRGFRVEPGEIEAALSRHPAVGEAAVLALPERSGSGLRLVAYLSPRQGEPVSPTVLGAWLRERLPEAFVPTGWVVLPALILLPNGKVDRRALARIEPDSGSSRPAYVAPRTAAEQVIAGLWADLLGLPRVGRTDNFFDLGGHSFLAARAVSRLQSAFGVVLPLRVLFEAPTVEALARRIGATASGVERPIRRREPGSLAPLSFGQQRLWFLDRLEAGSPVYTMPATVRLRGRLDVRALAGALEGIVRRHEILRTVFPEIDGRPVQAVLRAAPAKLSAVVDLEAVGGDAAELERVSLAEACRPFDLARGPLLRASILRLGEENHVLALALHHIVGDGWSVGIFLRELGELYGFLLSARPPELPELPIQYGDFAAWQRESLSGEALEEQVAYWRGRLADMPFLDLLSDRSRPATRSYRGALEPFVLPHDLTRSLEALGRREGATLFMTLLTSFGTLLSRYSGQEDFAVGVPIAGRGRRETEPLIGCFVNTLALRARLAGNPSWRQALARMREVCLEGYAHQDAPFERLVEELSPERDLSRSPLFQVMLVFEEEPRVLTLPGIDAELLPLDIGVARFDLTVSLHRSEAGLAGTAELATDLLDRATVRRLCGHFRALLQGVLHDAGKRLSDLPLMEEGELHQVLLAGTGIGGWAPGETLYELFAAQALRTPSAVALVVGEERLTYADLSGRANRWAITLRALGVGPEIRVAVCAERSADLVTAVLAVHCAGGAFVPLDPRYPSARLALMLEDCAASVLLTQTALRPALPSISGLRVVLLDGEPARADEAPAASFAGSGNAAYVIYTSGSTGRPKGVEIEHRSALGLVSWALETFPAAYFDGMLFATSICFDLSVFELFVPLACGGTVILADNILDLPNLPAAGEVTFLNTVPSAMAELLRLGAVPKSVRGIGLAGEPLRAHLVHDIERLGTVEAIYNLYGPTEDTTYSTWARVDGQGQGEMWAPPIGRPLAQRRAYVLDRWLQPLPAGVPGELFLAGAGLARGYLRRPDATAERFVPDPFASIPGERMYRSGDRCRLLPGGPLGLLGRLDHQVKVRGHRIELGEVEALLATHPEVGENVVLLHDAPRFGPSLVAYVEGSASADELRRYAEERLPSYMVPSSWVVLESLPRTPNGKVDRRALRLKGFDVSAGPLAPAYQKPRTPTEELIAEIWTELLDRKRIGVRDSFFSLGGHSLLATQVVSRLRTALGIEVPLRAIFDAPVLADFAIRIEGLRRLEGAALGPLGAIRRDRNPLLSFAQERLWLLEQLEPESAVYNLPAAVALRGALRGEILAGALREVVRRHEALRTVFSSIGATPCQRILPPAPLALPRLDLVSLPESKRRTEAMRGAAALAARPFDLATGPLLRCCLFRLAAAEHVLLLSMHHIVSDGWSMGVLVREVSALYSAIAEGRPSPLSELSVQYADYALWQRDRFRDDPLKSEIAWWRDQLSGAPEVLELPMDRPRRPGQSLRGRSLPLSLPSGLAEGLRLLSRNRGTTLFSTLLAGFQALLSRVTGKADFLVGTPVAHRTRTELEGLIGFFVNLLVLRARAQADPSFSELLARTHATALDAFEHQDLPFEKLVAELSPERGLSRAPLVQVAIALENAPLPTLALPGLEISPVTIDSGTSRFDLTVLLQETAEGIDATFEYSTHLFDPETIARLAGHYRNLLADAADHPELRLSELTLLNRAEQHQLLSEWSESVTAGPPDLMVHELVAERSRLAPEARAVEAGGEVLTYGELVRRSARLAARLRRLGIGAESRVGLCLERTADLVTSMLGILWAGAAYVPLDLAYPSERLAFMAKDAVIEALVTEERLVPALTWTGGVPIVFPDDEDRDEGGDHEMPRLGAEALAYVMYTSGSTGRPKGVAVTHRGIVRLVVGTNYVDLGASDRILQISNTAFDAATFEVWGALLNGGCLIGIDREVALSPRAFAAALRERRISALFLTASLFHQIAREVPNAFAPLRYALFGGEAGDPVRVGEVFAAGPPERLVNGYGPTEGTTFTTSHRIESIPDRNFGVPIGRPIGNTRVFLLDREFRPVPIGVPGELFAGGDGLARGYLGRPNLSAERFLPDPCSGEAGARLYRTGDLARFLPSGAIDFLGRIDDQIKIRGFRIEPGEVEARLSEHPSVLQCAVVARREAKGTHRLVAYVVPNGPQFQGHEVAAFLRAGLPEYLFPSAFVPLPALPLTANGKVDRRALPEPVGGIPSGREHVAPRNAVEELLAEIWVQVLGVEQVGAEDDFFSLGGHSLLAFQLMARIEETLGVALPLRTLFENSTLSSLALRVAEQIEWSAGEELQTPVWSQDQSPDSAAEVSREGST